MVMIGQLVQVCCPSDSSPELIDPVENSSREVVELRAEVERLKREDLEFRQQVGYWMNRNRDALNSSFHEKLYNRGSGHTTPVAPADPLRHRAFLATAPAAGAPLDAR